MSVSIRIGDCIEQMRLLPADSIDCVVTSPPYWGLRDYGTATWVGGNPDCQHRVGGQVADSKAKGAITTGVRPGVDASKCKLCGAVREDQQLGLEPTLAEHLAAMVAVFEEVRRVLKPEGTCWVNYGDCYATTPNGRSAAESKASGSDDRTFRDKPFSTIQGALKAKDLCMVPNRFAIAMQEAGWWVRSEIVWAKPNPMPESIKDRPATAHEKIFLFTKSARYFYDGADVKQGCAPASFARLNQDIESQAESHRANGGQKTNGPMKAVQFGGANKHAGYGTRRASGREDDGKYLEVGRNLRNYEPAPVNVWVIATRSFSEAHFATFPPELAERCIKAGCPAGGMVLDPFGGAGTTGLVADRLQRNAILIELNPEYAAIAQRRIDADRGGLLAAMEAAQ